MSFSHIHINQYSKLFMLQPFLLYAFAFRFSINIYKYENCTIIHSRIQHDGAISCTAKFEMAGKIYDFAHLKSKVSPGFIPW